MFSSASRSLSRKMLSRASGVYGRPAVSMCSSAEPTWYTTVHTSSSGTEQPHAVSRVCG